MRPRVFSAPFSLIVPSVFFPSFPYILHLETKIEIETNNVNAEVEKYPIYQISPLDFDWAAKNSEIRTNLVEAGKTRSKGKLLRSTSYVNKIVFENS